jgi:hypothetical protein
VLSKFPEVVGVAKYWARRIGGGPVRIIEHKEPGAGMAPAHR